MGSQTYRYDAFGNLSKTGSGNFGSFLPIYKNTSGYTSNRYVSIPGVTVSYDSNGNVLYDGLHTYTWDADGNSVTIDSVGVTFDALDRMVEQNRSGSHTQIVYAPTGAKLALMSGQNLQKSFIPLPAGAVAVYTSSGLDHYRHPDWLGSARLGSSTSRSATGFVSYAPFGETEASYGTANPSFTGQNQDTVPNLYDFPAREYDPLAGRWPEPDPGNLAAVIPGHPQSWNRYAYVVNDPLSLFDPTGMDYCAWDDGTSDDSPADGGATQAECIAQGGSWIPSVDTTVIVTATATGPTPDPIFDPSNGGSLLPPDFGAALGGNTSGSITWLQTKVFFQALHNNWESVLQTDCATRFVERIAADYVPNGAPSTEDLIRQGSAGLAFSYAGAKGLVQPLSSNIYRGILAGGEKLASWTAAAEFIHSEVNSLRDEYQEIKEGTCQGW